MGKGRSHPHQRTANTNFATDSTITRLQALQLNQSSLVSPIFSIIFRFFLRVHRECGLTMDSSVSLKTS